MAIIYSYPNGSSALASDTLTITRSSIDSPVPNPTFTLTIAQISAFVQSQLANGTPNYIPVFNASTTIIDSPMYLDDFAAPTLLTIGTNAAILGNATFTGGIQVANETQTDELLVSNQAEFNGECTFDDSMFINGALYDETNSAGAAGQVLSSTSQGVAWIAGDTDTTYDLTGAVSGGGDYKIVLTGSDGTVDNVNFEAGNGIILADQGSNTVQIQATNAGAVTGTGQTNFLPLWIDGPGGDLGDSIVKEEPGTAYNTSKNLVVNGNIYQSNMGQSVSIGEGLQVLLARKT